LIDDLLDLSKLDAGKTRLRPRVFTVASAFAALRGTMRPLATDPAVSLVIEDPGEDLTLHTDDGKLAQILRNLVSNALKFTARGEVRVPSATPESASRPRTGSASFRSSSRSTASGSARSRARGSACRCLAVSRRSSAGS
jgi:hypothetical protein